MKQYNDQERTNKQRTSTTHEGLHTNATRGVRPTPKTPSRRHRGESLSSFSFPPKRMALELVYRANGVRRPSPRGPPAGVGSQRPFAACTRSDFAATSQRCTVQGKRKRLASPLRTICKSCSCSAPPGRKLTPETPEVAPSPPHGPGMVGSEPLRNSPAGVPTTSPKPPPARTGPTVGAPTEKGGVRLRTPAELVHRGVGHPNPQNPPGGPGGLTK